MLKHFKKFSDYINSFRPKPFEFKDIVKDKALSLDSGAQILEVGCNIRPILTKSSRYSLDGLDPDEDIDLSVAKEKFDQFYLSTIEVLETDKKYDFIVMNMVLEHLPDNHITFDVLRKHLTENGEIYAFQPSNLHPFSILNQIFSDSFKVRILKLLRPWSKVGEITGWKSYYHKCNIISLKRLLKKHKLTVSDSKFGFNAADYFAFFPPLFLLIVLYEEIIKLLKLNVLCANFFVVIRHDY